MLSLLEIKKELDTAGHLRYIKINKKNQFYHYDYKNLTVTLRYNIVTETIEYISIMRKETKDNGKNQDNGN